MAAYWTLLETVVTTFFSLLYTAAVLLTSGVAVPADLAEARGRVRRASYDRAVTASAIPRDPATIAARLRARDPVERAQAACDASNLGTRAASLIPELVDILGDWTVVPGDTCRDGERDWKHGFFDDTSPGERAAAALVSIGSAAVRPVITALRASQWHTRKNAAWALGALGDDRAIAPLTGTLRDSEPQVRRNAAWALGALDAEPAVPSLVRTLTDTDSRARARAAWALGAIGSASALPGLIEAMQDQDERVRSQAAWALGAIGDTRAAAALSAALKDPIADVRRKAAWALAVIGN